MSASFYQLHFDNEMPGKTPITSEPRLPENFYKIVVVGDEFAGKSALIARFCDNYFREAYAPTIGVDPKERMITFQDKKRAKLEIYDCGGQEKFRSMLAAYSQNATGVILVYDVTTRSTFASLERYLRELKYHVSPSAEVIIAGTKCDLKDRRQVSFEEAERFASKMGISIFECSAEQGLNITDAFLEIASRIREKMELGPVTPGTILLDHVELHELNAGKFNWCSIFNFCATRTG